jgi:hypothetical protein
MTTELICAAPNGFVLIRLLRSLGLEGFSLFMVALALSALIVLSSYEIGKHGLNRKYTKKSGDK